MRNFICGFLLVAALAGCGDDSKGRRAVQGVVQFRGEPLDQGAIEFSPVGGPPGPAAGTMIRNGEFAIPAPQGLVPGSYRVSISSPKPGPPVQANPYAPFQSVERIAAKYNADSKLTVEVIAGRGPCTFSFNVE